MKKRILPFVAALAFALPMQSMAAENTSVKDQQGQWKIVCQSKDSIYKYKFVKLKSSEQSLKMAFLKPVKVESKQVKQPAKTEVTEVKQPAKTEATEVKQPAKTEATEVKQPAKTEATEVKQPAKTEATEVKQPAKTEATEVKQPAKTEATEVKQPAKTEATEVKQPTKVEEAPKATETKTDNNSAILNVEQEVVRLVNVEREKQGLQPLTMDPALQQVAKKKSEDMKANNYFSHTSPTYGSPFDMMKQFGISYTSAGENIAMGQKSAAEVVNAWMNSEGHRANILNTSYTHIGVGYVESGHYWTQMFIKK